MKQYGNKDKPKTYSTYTSRREFIKIIACVPLLSAGGIMSKFAVAAAIPPEPQNLDQATAWQEGDPEPKQANVPATEPMQSSKEDPPSQPMDDDRGTQPGANYSWVYGYWWWSNNQYVWVPGYWAIPPNPEYIYIPGYWTHQNGLWVYAQGGWGLQNSTAVAVYASPRPIGSVFVYTAPIRIIRRNRHWHHHHPRRRYHRPHRSHHSNLRPKSHTKVPARRSSKISNRAPSATPNRGSSTTPARGGSVRTGGAVGPGGPGGAGGPGGPGGSGGPGPRR